MNQFLTKLKFYVFSIFEHTLIQQSFKMIYKAKNIKVDYSVFMKNVKLFSKILDIKTSKLLNMVDTTLIPGKLTRNITKKDLGLNRVTCSSKCLFFVNRRSQIYHAELLNINFSDANVLKDSAKYKQQIKGISLADQGFNSKMVEHDFLLIKIIFLIMEIIL